MNGTIPETLGGLSKLVAIELSENPLTGVVTEAHFSNLTSLKEFSNYRVTPRVSLVFNISPEWIPPFKLSLLRIRSCQMVMLGSQAPYRSGFGSWICILMSWTSVLITWVAGSRSLLECSKWHHSLSFRKLTNLLTLVISNNHLSGGIPEFWNGLPDLYVLDMNNNNLSGELPSSMGSLRFVRFLMISNNHLSGEIPSALQNCTAIRTLDLGGNRFSGNVPAWIGERMPNLLILRKIPDKIGSLQGLETLDLSRNQLSGVIPPGNQLQTLDDPSIYENNPALCGPPTTAKCPGDDEPPKPLSGDSEEDENENGNGFEMKWFYVSMGPGFAVGFWGVCGTLIVKDSWRHAYFRLVYDVKEWLLMVISLNVARLRRKLNLGCSEGHHHRAACIETERVALLKFKQGLTDPSHRFSSWVGEECCKGRGLVCNNRIGHVIKLNLRSLNDDGTDGKLGGEISLSLVDLKYLNYFLEW
ncbi:hypothetical protein AAG906_022255 [Vitis piasezkii]